MALCDAAALTGLEPRLADEVVVDADAGPEDRFLAFIGRAPRDRYVIVG